MTENRSALNNASLTENFDLDRGPHPIQKAYRCRCAPEETTNEDVVQVPGDDTPSRPPSSHVPENGKENPSSDMKPIPNAPGLLNLKGFEIRKK